MGQILSNIAQSIHDGGCGAEEEERISGLESVISPPRLDFRSNFTSDRVSAHVLRSSTSAVFQRNQPTSSGSSVLHSDSSSNATPQSLDFGRASSKVDSRITGYTSGYTLRKNTSISPMIWKPLSDSSTSNAFLPTTPPCSNSDSASESSVALQHKQLISLPRLDSCINSRTNGEMQTELLGILGTPRSSASSCGGPSDIIEADLQDSPFLTESKKRRRRRRRRRRGKIESRQGDVQLYKECPVKEIWIKKKRKEIWIKHYSSLHKMLLVGEGDFSFSASLALAFGSAINMIATSLDSLEFLASNYRSALANIQDLKFRGCTVLHGIDATQMENSCLLKGMMFDRIIFNFPHAGCFRNESHPSQIRRHQELVRLFLKNAKELILQEGEIHISHKSNACRQLWNLEHLAVSVGLHLKGQEDFALEDYPGYNTKYGYAQFGDRNFDCYPSKTYRFGL